MDQPLLDSEMSLILTRDKGLGKTPAKFGGHCHESSKFRRRIFILPAFLTLSSISGYFAI